MLLGLVAFWHSTWRFATDARATLLAFAEASSVQTGAQAPIARDGFDPERPQDGQTIVL
ncbi:hypothetical protein Q0F99_19350 [Rathayibacter oskolensis]|uniref:hypothetical protein n=1 Tax=Rathayibacter oskolensis TaxID=1891671 RepID=UPI00265FFE5D|nr:hypothetical protein [Rathayibacter oskolensis]WKK71493.1 hypothetical protein Q0F99_19350 [Rathayibacter oskolensis]